MARVGVEIEYGSKGSDKAAKDITKITTSFSKMETVAGSVGVVGNQYAELAKKVLEGAKAFYEFAKAGAKTSDVRREFIAFEAQLDVTSNKLKEISANALAGSGTLARMSEFLQTFTEGLGEGTVAGEVFSGVIRGLFEAIAWGYEPIKLAIDGINWLGESLGLTVPKSKEATKGFYETVDALIAMADKARKARDELQFFEDATKRGFGEASQNDVEKWATTLQDIAFGSEDQYLSLANDILLVSNSEEDFRRNLEATAKVMKERGQTGWESAAAVERMAKVGKDLFELDAELEKNGEENSKKKITRQKNEADSLQILIDKSKEYFALFFSGIDALSEYNRLVGDNLLAEKNRVEKLREEIALREQIAQVQKDTNALVFEANRQIAEMANQESWNANYKAAFAEYRAQELQRNSDIADDLAEKFQNTFNQDAIGKKGAAGVSAFTKNLREMYKYIDAGNTSTAKTTALFLKGTNDLIGATAEEGWFKAGLQAALETGFGIATAFTNPFESVTHFAAAAQFLIAQAFAGKKSGKGASGNSGGGTGSGAGMGFSGAKTTNNANDDKIMVIEVDGEDFGRVATKSINKATRYGQTQLSSSTLTKPGKRIL